MRWLWIAQSQSAAPAPPEPASAATEEQTQIVRLKLSPAKSGPILRVLPGAPENRFDLHRAHFG